MRTACRLNHNKECPFYVDFDPERLTDSQIKKIQRLQELYPEPGAILFKKDMPAWGSKRRGESEYEMVSRPSFKREESWEVLFGRKKKSSRKSKPKGKVQKGKKRWTFCLEELVKKRINVIKSIYNA